MTFIIDVDQEALKKSRKVEENIFAPINIRIKEEDSRDCDVARKAHEVVIHGPSKIVHNSARRSRMPFGATVWIETDGPITADGSYIEI